jgi:hypothetical protein
MDFSWPQEYLDYKDQVAAFAAAELNGDAAADDHDQRFPRELWERCADFGIQGLSLPQAYGGALEEADFVRALLAMEGLGYGCRDNGLAFALNAQMWTVQVPIRDFGSEEQKQKYLPAMAAGKLIGAHALTEAEAGSDVMNMQLAAEPQPDGGYLLNGAKRYITLGPIADVVLVFAKTKPKLGAWGISAFLVDKGTPGFVQSDKKNKMGMRSVPIGSFEFKDCYLPSTALLGKDGMGYAITNHSLEYDRCAILASQLGAMERQLEETVAYARGRKQFGQSVGKFQAVSHRIVDMKMRLETSRLLLHKTAWLKQRGKSAVMEAAMLKLQLSEAFVTSSMDAIRTRGADAYLGGGGVDRDMRDAIGGVLYAGTSDIQ